jgi:hypothetical protein
MIDGMIKTLHEEQDSDDEQKEFCEHDLAKGAQDQKDSENAIEATEATIQEFSYSWGRTICYPMHYFFKKRRLSRFNYSSRGRGTSALSKTSSFEGLS